MSFVLDTNVCIFALRGRAEVITALRKADPAELAVTSITLAELWFGARKSAQPKRMRAMQDAFLEPLAVLDFDAQAADEYARIRLQLEKQGRPIGERDQMIAAIACARVMTLVTNNAREFARVPGLRVVDWSVT